MRPRTTMSEERTRTIVHEDALLGCLTQHNDGDVGVIIGVYEDSTYGYLGYDVFYFKDGMIRGMDYGSISNILY